MNGPREDVYAALEMLPDPEWAALLTVMAVVVRGWLVVMPESERAVALAAAIAVARSHVTVT